MTLFSQSDVTAFHRIVCHNMCCISDVSNVNIK